MRRGLVNIRGPKGGPEVSSLLFEALIEFAFIVFVWVMGGKFAMVVSPVLVIPAPASMAKDEAQQRLPPATLTEDPGTEAAAAWARVLRAGSGRRQKRRREGFMEWDNRGRTKLEIN